MEVQDDEISLTDLWLVIRKRLHFIIVFTLLVFISALAISLRLPKIYEGEAVVVLPRSVSAVETKAIIDAVVKNIKEGNPVGGFDKELIADIVDINIDQVKGSDSHLKIVVQVKKDSVKGYEIYNKIIDYLHRNEYIMRKMAIDRAAVESNIAETKNSIENAVRTRNESMRLLSTRNPVGFNPVDLDVRISELKLRAIGLETSLSMLRGYEFISGPHMSKNKIMPKVKNNAIIAGVVALFVSLILVFVFEAIERQKLVKS